jgi:hypothetical protein
LINRSPIAPEKKPYVAVPQSRPQTRPTTAKNLSMIILHPNPKHKQTLVEAKKEIEKIKFFPREPPKPRKIVLKREKSVPNIMHVSKLQTTSPEETVLKSPKPSTPKYNLGKMLKSRPMTAASSISVSVPKKAIINSLLFDDKDLEVLNMIGNASTLNRYQMFFVNDEETIPQRPQTAKKEFVNIHMERKKEIMAKRKNLKSASTAKKIKPLISGFPFGVAINFGKAFSEAGVSL